MPGMLLSTLIVLGLSWAIEAVSLNTRLGELEGLVQTTPSGKQFYSFTSIPYAKPPIGSLRLKNPVSYGSWSSKLDATKPAPVCTQVIFFVPPLRNKTFGQEDCLYLNIYTPSLDNIRKLPVLVYVHGGGFRCGSPGTPDRATNLMEKDIVHVSIQYRLGSLGFLSTEDSEIPGNFGMKDQALAIKWIYENIDQFGGNPKSIVVFGESAGGASSHYLLTSPLSRDYIQGAIAESGVIQAAWAFAPPTTARNAAAKIADLFGCDISNNLLECLQKIDAEELINVERNFVVWDFDPAVVFPPVIEPEADGAFMTEDLKAVKSDKPLITGVVTGEGLIKIASLVNEDDSLLDEFINNIDDILPKLLFPGSNNARTKEFITAIKERYFSDLTSRTKVLDGLQDFYNDMYFAYPFYLAMEQHSGPVYGYVFHHRGQHSLADLAGPNKINSELPSHADEILSIFNWTKEFPGPVREEDRKVSQKIVEYWTNFAEYRDPTPESSPVDWEPYNVGKNVLHIGTHEDHMGPIGINDVIEFLDKTFKILSTPLRSEL